MNKPNFGISRKQEFIYIYIHSFLHEHGQLPTEEQIIAELRSYDIDIDPIVLRYSLRKLKNVFGLINYEEGKELETLTFTTASISSVPRSFAKYEDDELDGYFTGIEDYDESTEEISSELYDFDCRPLIINLVVIIFLLTMLIIYILTKK